MRRALVVLLALLALAPAAALAQGRTYVPFQAFTTASTGATFSVPLLLPDGSATAPAVGPASNTTAGFYFPVAGEVLWTYNTLPRWGWRGTGIWLRADAAFAWSASTLNLTAADTFLYRDAANTLALRNSTNPQAFYLYNTFTDSSNYERARLGWSANIFEIKTENAGTGSFRAMTIVAPQLTLPNTIVPPSNDAGTIGGSAGTWSWQSIYLTRSIQGSKSKTLTESSATAVVQIAVPSGGHTSGTIYGEVYCADATDFVTYYNEWRFTCHNKAGTEGCSNPTAAGTAVSSASSGGSISAFTWSVDTSPTNAVNLSVNTTCSLTQTTLEFHYRVHLLDPQTVTPQ